MPPWATDVWKKVVLLLRDTDSVGRLQREVRHARRVIVVGGGGIGMEVVHELDNCEIVWLLRGLNFGGRFFDNRLAEILEKHVDTQLSSQEPNDGTTSDRKDRDEFDVHGAGVGPEWLGRRTGDTAIFFDRGGMQEERVTERKLRAAANGRCVRIKKECEIKRLEKDESGRWPVVAELSDGNAYGCDLIIVGAGVVPNVDWLQGSGIQLAEEGGIIVNAGSFETSVRGLFAAGDCTHCIPESDTDWFQMRLWTQALTAGRASARNMARYVMDGEGYMGLEYDLFSHATSFFGKDVVFLGRFQAQDVGSGYRMYEREDEDFVRVVVRDRRIVGVVLVGCVERAETYENLMLGRVDIEFLGDGIVAKELELEEYFD